MIEILLFDVHIHVLCVHVVPVHTLGFVSGVLSIYGHSGVLDEQVFGLVMMGGASGALKGGGRCDDPGGI